MELRMKFTPVLILLGIAGNDGPAGTLPVHYSINLTFRKGPGERLSPKIPSFPGACRDHLKRQAMRNLVRPSSSSSFWCSSVGALMRWPLTQVPFWLMSTTIMRLLR